LAEAAVWLRWLWVKLGAPLPVLQKQEGAPFHLIYLEITATNRSIPFDSIPFHSNTFDSVPTHSMLPA